MSRVYVGRLPEQDPLHAYLQHEFSAALSAMELAPIEVLFVGNMQVMSANAQRTLTSKHMLFIERVDQHRRRAHPVAQIFQEINMNKDQTTGRIKQVEGKIKEVAGNLVGNKDLEIKGKVENIRGKAQATFGDAKSDIKAALKKK